jgi:hypothetical protein
LTIIILESEIKPTALCIINANSSHPAMQMAYTKPLFNAININQEFDFISGAKVNIIGRNNLFNFIEDTRTNMYISNEGMRLNPGENYTLDIALKDGRKMTATQTVPASIEEYEFSIEESEDQFGFTQPYLRYRIKIASNIKVFLGLSGQIVSIPIKEEQIFSVSYDSRLITSDNAINGFVTGRIPVWSFVEEGQDIYQYAIITSLTEDLYKYYLSTKFDLNSVTPFSEPAPMYTNINGGLGIFGIQNQQIIEFK